MARTRARFTEELYATQEEIDEAATVPELPKSPCTPQPQKNKKTMGLVRISPRFNKLSRAEKGKAITTKPKEDDKDLQDLIDQIDTEDEDKENAFQISSWPPYISLWT